jgi:hypothetical protein
MADKVVDLVKSSEIHSKGYPTCDSPLLTSSNPARKQ